MVSVPAALRAARSVHTARTGGPALPPILFWAEERTELMVQAADPAPHPEETQERNNEQRPQDAAGGADVCQILPPHVVRPRGGGFSMASSAHVLTLFWPDTMCPQ